MDDVDGSEDDAESTIVESTGDVSMNDSAFLGALQSPAPAETRLRERAGLGLPVRIANDYDLSGRRKKLPAMANVTEIRVPMTYREAVSGDDAARWTEAIQAELEAHRRNGTWKVQFKPGEARRISSKWVFRVQEHKIGGGLKYKARLVARGHLQRRGENFDETVACVSRYETARVVIAWAVQEQLYIDQFDAETVFLHGDLEEQIYMSIPEGLLVTPDEGDVLLLKKALYGLRQAPRCWFRKFGGFLRSLGFELSQADGSLFIAHKYQFVVYLILFVDDGLILRKSKKLNQSILKEINRNFKIKISEPGTYVGMNMVSSETRDKIFIHQGPYAEMLLEKFGMLNCKPATTPPEGGIPDEESENVVVPYRELVGSLMFLATVSRPDFAFAVSFLSRFLTRYKKCRWEAAKRVLRYVKGTINYGLLYRRTNDFNFVCYSDSDYAGDVERRRSTSGCVFLLTGAPVLWYSRRQDVVALSTTEAEYIAGWYATREAVWLRRLLSEIRGERETKICIFIDNQSAIKLTKNPKFHKKSKHIEVRFHYIRECYAKRWITVKYVPTDRQLADGMTKPLSRLRFELLRDQFMSKKGD